LNIINIVIITAGTRTRCKKKR